MLRVLLMPLITVQTMDQWATTNVLAKSDAKNIIFPLSLPSSLNSNKNTVYPKWHEYLI